MTKTVEPLRNDKVGQVPLLWLGGAVMPLLVTILVGFSLAGFLSLFPARFCDFRAFYCSGRVVLAGQDPYREHPLHECEQSLPGPFLSSLDKGVTIPAPYPGYALVAFSVVARLPFNSAVAVWTFGSFLALAAAIVFIARLTSTPLYASLIALGFPAVIVPLPLGQPTLFVLCAIASCAALLRANRPRLAALAALFTAIEPQVGLSVCLGITVAAPRTRLIVFAGAITLLASSTISFGPAREWEYVRDVLPLHGLVNVPEFSQFSIANLAFAAGLERHLALTFGNIWYAGSLVVGVAVGLRLRSRLGIAAVAFVPVAFAVFGGAHTHLQQLALAFPAFLLVTSAAKGRRRGVLVVATFIACVPWLIAAPFPYLFFAVGLLGVAFARLMGAAQISLALGVTCSVVLASLLSLIIICLHTRTVSFASPKSGNPLAEVAWGLYVNATSLPAETWYLFAKAPTLLAFFIMLGALLTSAMPKSTVRIRHVSPEAAAAKLPANA